jgi:hypothetical protein
LYILPKQNRELPYASWGGASRVKYKLKLCPDGIELRVIRKQACEVKAGLRQSRVKEFVTRYESVKDQSISPGTTANQSWRKRVSGYENRYCSLTARWYGELPSVSGLACVFAKSR